MGALVVAHQFPVEFLWALFRSFPAASFGLNLSLAALGNPAAIIVGRAACRTRIVKRNIESGFALHRRALLSEFDCYVFGGAAIDIGRNLHLSLRSA